MPWGINSKLKGKIANMKYDIEDMKLYSKEHKICGYYYGIKNNSDADLIFMPYNYLINERIMKAMSINIEDTILIVDEAHNIENKTETMNSM